MSAIETAVGTIASSGEVSSITAAPTAITVVEIVAGSSTPASVDTTATPVGLSECVVCML